ncbi:MAG: hypothetical protein KDC12_06720 [Flavobacteriales bacterium]|nr:hypothetical protein [Flavobacteriales bacterium]
MKRSMIVAGSLLLVVFFSAFSTAPRFLNLIEAQSVNDLEIEMTASGGSSSECAVVAITNRTSDPVRIRIEPGMRLIQENEEYQDILVTQPSQILVDRWERVELPVHGYCCESSDRTPEAGLRFSQVEAASDELSSLAIRISDGEYSPSQSQAAIWSISDGTHLGAIYDDEAGEELMQYCADMRGEEMPWYQVDYGDILDRPFSNEPVRLSGEMSYVVDHLAHADLLVYGPDGKVILTFYEGKVMTPAMYKQSFAFSATDLAPGDYVFTLLLDGQVKQTETVTI